MPCLETRKSIEPQYVVYNSVEAFVEVLDDAAKYEIIFARLFFVTVAEGERK